MLCSLPCSRSVSHHTKCSSWEHCAMRHRRAAGETTCSADRLLLTLLLPGLFIQKQRQTDALFTVTSYLHVLPSPTGHICGDGTSFIRTHFKPTLSDTILVTSRFNSNYVLKHTNSLHYKFKPTHCSQRVGDVVPGVVVWSLCLFLMVGWVNARRY